MDTNEKQKAFFDRYYRQTVSYGANEVDAVIGYFQKRGFEDLAATNTAVVLLQQAKKDGVNVFKLIDTLKGVSDVELSNVVGQILNSSRSKTSNLGYRVPTPVVNLEERNIIY